MTDGKNLWHMHLAFARRLLPPSLTRHRGRSNRPFMFNHFHQAATTLSPAVSLELPFLASHYRCGEAPPRLTPVSADRPSAPQPGAAHQLAADEADKLIIPKVAFPAIQSRLRGGWDGPRVLTFSSGREPPETPKVHALHHMRRAQCLVLGPRDLGGLRNERKPGSERHRPSYW